MSDVFASRTDVFGSWLACLGPVLGLPAPLGTLGSVVGDFGPFLAALSVTWLGYDAERDAAPLSSSGHSSGVR